MSSMTQTEPVRTKPAPDAQRWVDICALDELPFDAGVAALLD